MAAGCATLDLLNDDAHAHLEALGALLEELVTPVLARHGHPMRLVRQASLFWFSPGPEAPPRRSDLIPSTAGVLYADVCQACSNAATCWRLPRTKWASFQPPTKRTTSKASWRRWTRC